MEISESSPFLEYFSPSVLCDFDANSEIKNTALRLVADDLDTSKKAESIHKFAKGLLYRFDDWNIKASETLMRGWGMCSGKTNLLVAMLRSLQIPARYVIVRCQAEIELYQWLIDQDLELARILGEPYREADHICAEVLIEDKWQVLDPARDPALEAGFRSLGIPVEMRPLSRISLSSFDAWALSRQGSVRVTKDRQPMLKMMNDQLDRIRLTS